MPFKRPLARREIIGLTVIAVCLVGVAVIGVLLVTNDDGGGGQTTTQVEAPIAPDPEDQGGGRTSGGVEARPPRRAPRRPVRAPDFSAGVVEKGTLPGPVNAKLGDALDDGKLTLDELSGTPTVLTAFNSKCAFCGPEARLLQAEWERWGPRGVLYLGLSVRESADSARVLTEQSEVDFPVVGDQTGKIARELDVSGIPETLFIDDRARIIGRVIGGASIGQLEAGSSAARTGRSFGVQQGGARVPIQ